MISRPEEAGQYLATYKLYEFKSHQLIKERIDADYSSILRAALTTVRGVNKTDVMTLRTNFGVSFDCSSVNQYNRLTTLGSSSSHSLTSRTLLLKTFNCALGSDLPKSGDYERRSTSHFTQVGKSRLASRLWRNR